jgi:hypothetical protein
MPKAAIDVDDTLLDSVDLHALARGTKPWSGSDTM